MVTCIGGGYIAGILGNIGYQSGTNIGATSSIPNGSITLNMLATGTQGDILYYGAAGAPTLLHAGVSGQYLKTLGAAANPAWATVAGGGAWAVVADTLLGAVATSVDFSSLDIGTNKAYMLIFALQVNADGTDIMLYMNGDTTDTDYYLQQVYSTGVIVGGERNNNPRLFRGDTNGTLMGQIVFMRHPSGYNAAQGQLTIGTGGNWNGVITSYPSVGLNSNANLTEITITSKNANAIKAGSRFMLLKRQ